MSTQTVAEQVRWQDLRVKSEIDIVLEIANKQGWQDCEVFGYGDMITGPQESMGWKLIPADLYKYSIPMAAVERLSQVINSGVRVRGVVIADDQRRAEPAAAPAGPGVSRPSLGPVVAWVGKALLGLVRAARAAGAISRKAFAGLVRAAGTAVSFSGKVLLGLVRAAGLIALVSFLVLALVHFWPVIAIGGLVVLIVGAGSSLVFDPKLIILVDDGRGGTVWVSLYTWYD